MQFVEYFIVYLFSIFTHNLLLHTILNPYIVQAVQGIPCIRYHLLDYFTVFQCDFRKMIVISILKMPNGRYNVQLYYVPILK